MLTDSVAISSAILVSERYCLAWSISAFTSYSDAYSSSSGSTTTSDVITQMQHSTYASLHVSFLGCMPTTTTLGGSTA
jgi:hypothetical protein